MASVDPEQIDRSTSERWFDEGPVAGSPIRVFRNASGLIVFDYGRMYSLLGLLLTVGFVTVFLGVIWGAATMALRNNVASPETVYLSAFAASTFVLAVVSISLLCHEWKRRKDKAIPPILRCEQTDGQWIGYTDGEPGFQFDQLVLIEGRTQKRPLFENNSLLAPAPYAHLLWKQGDDMRLLVSFVRPTRQPQKTITARCKEFGIPISIHSISIQNGLPEHAVVNRNSQWQIWR